MEKLQLALKQLTDRIIADGQMKLPAWTPLDLPADEQNELMIYRHAIAHCYSSIFFEEQADPRHTEKMVGFLAASDATMHLINSVNALKRECAKHYQALLKTCPGRERRLLAEALKEKGLQRLHTKQLTRQIATLDERPERIGFSVSGQKGYYPTITVGEAIERLCRFGEDKAHIQMQIETLTRLGLPSEARCLRILSPGHYPQIVANIRFRGDYRKTKKLSMPVAFSSLNDAPPPIYSLNRRVTEIDDRVVTGGRSDRIYDDTPLLPSLQAYLIKQEDKR